MPKSRFSFLNVKAGLRYELAPLVGLRPTSKRQVSLIGKVNFVHNTGLSKTFGLETNPGVMSE
ncbi:MAG: hypothetical protein ABS85_03055 [Sphingobacteriales bacterium SCN 48-20]|nr:MAG: hypothetical protein ABS85_03055 [Sphingobacteriales bacterium SCN 48-20]